MLLIFGTIVGIGAVIAIALELPGSAVVLGAVAYFLITKG